MKNYIVLLLVLILYVGCRGKNKEESVEIGQGLNDFTPEETHILITGTIDSTNTVAKPSKPTNEKEKKADAALIQKIENDLEKSPYNSCDEILLDYEKRIEALRNGNRKLFLEFPKSSDPNIALCKIKDKDFAFTLDSLDEVANRILDDL